MKRALVLLLPMSANEGTVHGTVRAQLRSDVNKGYAVLTTMTKGVKERQCQVIKVGDSQKTNGGVFAAIEFYVFFVVSGRGE